MQTQTQFQYCGSDIRQKKTECEENVENNENFFFFFQNRNCLKLKTNVQTSAFQSITVKLHIHCQFSETIYIYMQIILHINHLLNY